MDWKAAIAELARLGVTQPQIAHEAGCSQGAVSLLATGKTKDPRDSLGQAIRSLLDKKRHEAAEKSAAAHPPGGAPSQGAATAAAAGS